MSVTVSFKNASKNPFKRASVKSATAVWAEEVGPIVVRAIKVKAPVGKKPGSGKLRDSITYRHYPGYSASSIRFGSRVPYAEYVEDGTPPHLIYPRSARVLSWRGKGGDQVHARFVSHPGTKPNPFARNAVRAMVPFMQQRLREITQAEFRSI